MTQIKVGPTGTLKNETDNMAKITEKETAVANAKAKGIEAKEGEVLYRKAGEPIFNCFNSAGQPIVFYGGRYLTSDEADIEALEYHVKVGTLEILQDKRTAK